MVNTNTPDRDATDDGDPTILVPCPTCGALRDKDDLVEVQVSRQTHWEPAEYETYCDRRGCMPARFREDDEPDPDRYRD